MVNETPDFCFQTLQRLLREAMEHKGLSMREVSLSAGLNQGYFFGVIVDGKEPTIGKLAKICRSLDVPLPWIVGASEKGSEDLLPELRKFLLNRSEADQERILTALVALSSE